jgi:hypothetical protein
MKINVIKAAVPQRKPQNFCPWYIEDYPDTKK